MKKKRLSKQQLFEKQKLDNKKFNKTMLISFSILFLSLMSTLVFYTYRCDTRLAWHKMSWFGKEVPKNWVCMNRDNIQIHESIKTVIEDNSFYFCSQQCYNHLIAHYGKVAFTTDSFTRDSICKGNAIIGLKNKGKPTIIYFKNKQNFDKYYEARNKK